MAQGCIDHHAIGEVVVNQVDVVSLLHVEVRISVTEGRRVGSVHVGVQVGNARTGDAQVVAQADVLGHGGTPLDAGTRDQAAVIHAERLLLGGRVVGLPGVLIADTALDPELSESAGILGIDGADAVVEVVSQIAEGIVDEIAAVPEIGRLVGGIVPVDVFCAGIDGLAFADGGGEIGLDRVAQGVLQAVGPAVGEVEALGRGPAEGIAGVHDRRAAVELIGQGEVPARRIGPEVLVVGSGADVVAGILGVRRAVVRERVAGHGHFRGRSAGGGHAEAHQAGRGGDQVQGVDLVTGIDRAHHHGHVHVGLAVGLGDHTSLLDTFHIGGGAGIPVVHRIEVHAQGEFSFLHAAVQAAAVTAGGGHAAEGAVEAVGHVLSAGHLPVGRDVQDAAHTLGVVPDARIGHDLDVLHGARRHHLEDGGSVLGEHLVGFSIDIDDEGGGAVDGDVVLAVHGDHGHLPEHVQDGGGLGVHVVLHIIGHPVHLHLHQRPLGGDGAGFQDFGGILDKDFAQVDDLVAVDGEIPAHLFPAHVVEEQIVVSLDGEGMGERAVLGRGRKGDGLGGVIGLEELQDGGGFALAGQGIEDDTFDGADFLRGGGKPGEKDGQKECESFHKHMRYFCFRFRVQKYRNMQAGGAGFRPAARFFRRNPYRRALMAFVASS